MRALYRKNRLDQRKSKSGEMNKAVKQAVLRFKLFPEIRFTKGCFHQRITQQTIFFQSQDRLRFLPIFPANLRNVNFDKI